MKLQFSAVLVILIVCPLVLVSGLQLNIAQGATQVGGIIWDNTTWTKANSPYTITETIQIPENVTLTIEPGVIVSKSTSGELFRINGNIIAHGTPTNKIIFESAGNSDFFKTNTPIAKGFADLDYCIIRNGKSAFYFDNTGYFNLRHSELSNITEPSYLWYPTKDIFIEYNTFTNAAGFRVGTNDYSILSPYPPPVIVNIRFNLFINNNGYVVNNYASYGLTKTVVSNNSFVNMAGIVLQLMKGAYTANMTATENYWGTNNTEIISSMIYDKNDDISCANFISYLPILQTPNPDTPLAPTPSPTSSPTPAPIATSTPTLAPTSMHTSTPSLTLSPIITPQPTNSPAPTPTPTLSTPTAIPTATPTLTPTQSPMSSPVTSPIQNPTAEPTATTQPTTSPSSQSQEPTASLEQTQMQALPQEVIYGAIAAVVTIIAVAAVMALRKRK